MLRGTSFCILSFVMETRSLEITVTSAKGLKKVKNLFVAVKLSGDPKCSDHGEQRTQVVKDSGTSPKFSNDVLKLSIDQTLAEANRLVVTFKIKCEQGGGDKDIGEVHVPVKELLDHLGNDKTGQRYVTYKIKQVNGNPNGEISFTYSFGGPVVVKSGEGCSRYVVHELGSPSAMYHQPVSPSAAYRPVSPPATYVPFNPSAMYHQPVSPSATYRPVSPSATYGSVQNRPVLSMLLPNEGSFSYGHDQPPIYPSVAHQSPTSFHGLYPPQGYPTSYIPESLSTMYPPVAPPLFPGLSYPPEGYPTVGPSQTQPGPYPPMSPYRF